MKVQQTLCILLTTTLFISCSQTSTEKKEEVPDVAIEKSEQIEAPEILISLEQAKEQLDFYNEAHPAEVGSEYAFRTWIPIEELKAYIRYVEASSVEKGIEISGIDVIHAQYKRASPGSANPNNSVYDETLMLAPTYKNGDKNIAFDPFYSELGEPKNLETLFDTLNEDPDGGYGGDQKSSIANTFISCPNTCN